MELIWIARFGAFLLLALYFLVFFPILQQNIVYFLLIFFLVYNIIVGFTGLKKYERFINKKVKTVQVIIEIILYSLFYYYSGNASSGIYFLYFLPLLVAAGLLDPLQLVGVIGLAASGVFGVVTRLAPPAEAVNIYGPRIAFMVGLTLFFGVSFGLRRRVEAMAEERKRMVAERERWLQTYNELSKQLAVHEDPEKLLDLVATEAQKRLHAETAAVFLLENERLVRKAQAGIEPEWFPEESYRLGEGLTGKCLVPAPGERYGRPILENHVDLSAEVVPENLRRYREKLPSHQVKHLAAVPLNDRERSFGVLRVVNRRGEGNTLDLRGFAQDDVDFLAGIAAITGVAIAYAHQVEEVNRHAEEVGRLYEAAQVMTSSLDRDEVLRRIIAITTAVVASDLTGVLLVDREGNPLTSVESHPMPVPLHRRIRPDGVSRRVLSTRQWYNVSDTRLNPQEHNPIVFQEGYRSYAGVPLVSQDAVHGVLFVHSRQPYAFDTHKELLTTFAHQIALSVHNAELYEQKQEESEVLDKLSKAAKTLITHISLQDLYNYCVQAGKEIFDVEDCSLYIINEKQGTVDLVASSTVPPTIWKKRESRLNGPGLTPYVARTGELLNLAGNAIFRHPAWAGHQEEPFREHLAYLPSQQSHSLLMGPLLDNRGRIVGVLKLENRRGEAAGYRFSAFQESLHQTYASHIATAIERARLWARVDEDAARRARKSLEFDIHEMKNFVHGAIVLPSGVARTQLRRARHDLAEQQLEQVNRAARSACNRLDSLMNDVSNYLPMLEQQGLLPTLDELGRTMEIPIQFDIKLAKRPNYNIEYALYRIAKEALINYKKHSSTSEPCLIRFYVDENDRIELEISDNGVGFDNANILEREDATGIQLMKYWADEIRAHFCISSLAGICSSTVCPGHGEDDSRLCSRLPREQGTVVRVIVTKTNQEDLNVR
ncbi:MAG: GAF domain-containing protein [Anaerolineae bacterium]|nr:GAF domain-containing protein [Anaerolineae bacterium]